MSTITDLDRYIRSNIIKPAISEEGIRKTAKEKYNRENNLTEKQTEDLYDHIINNTIVKIDEFLKSEQAKTICKDASLMDAHRSYRYALWRSPLEERINTLAAKTTVPASTFDSYVWKPISYVWNQIAWPVNNSKNS